MSVLDIFKPPPHTKEIQDPKIVKKKYAYWRIRTFYSMYIGYAFFYLSRKSFTFAMPAMALSLGLDKSQLGMLASILNLTYGASKFFSGIMSDRSNPRYFMAIGLILTGIFNIFFGFSSTFVLFAIFWGLNGWFQGWGWPPCGKLLTHWYSQSERGRWWSIWNTSHNVGGALIPLFAAALAQTFGWRFAMFGPGVICIFAGIFLINRLRDTPRSLGLPTIEKYKKDYPSKKHEKSRYQLSTKEILLKYVLKNKYIWILAVSYFFIYIIRQAINDWTLVYLVETKGYSYIVAGTCLFWFEIGGFVGSLAAGWGSDFIFKGKRGPVNILFTLGVLISLYLMWKSPGGVVLVQSILIFFIGFFIFGPQMLIGVAAAELSHKKAVGTATGFIGWFAYVGAAMAGAPLGAMIKKLGWEGFFLILTVSSILALLFLLPLWRVKTNPQLEADQA
ncbi:MAG: Membrane sensor protein UhpC [Candidatus Anoxychlamydiales bacterium]|nr:Membrane sensor protein UhpC [Candidatus Anoxychlamydiales bacterium]NGX40368.1 Membrane sensor protein UhpC [Candidatus Anoxychlamydiales bacterium]HEU64649.1 MFS transporter [Chlamydiota bacterium]